MKNQSMSYKIKKNVHMKADVLLINMTTSDNSSKCFSVAVYGSPFTGNNLQTEKLYYLQKETQVCLS